MSNCHESGVHLTSWRGAASTISLCDRCNMSYSSARYCDGCLREADADLSEKRGILFPQAYDAADSLSVIV